jgi:DNA-binding transcriptional MocR family regulator
MHTVIKFNREIADRSFVASLSRAGVEATALSRFYLSASSPRQDQTPQGLLLGFSGFTPAEIRRGIETVRTVFATTDTI